MATNNDTKVRISAETAQAEAQLRTLGQSVDGLTRNFFNLSSVAGTLGGALSVTAFAGFIKSSIDAADTLNDLSQKTGASVETLAGLRLAAEQSGTSMEAIALSAKRLSTEMADKPDLFKKFGITATDTTGALIQLSDIFARMPDGVEKSALAVKLLGRSGEEMIPLLNHGSEALRKMVEDGQRLNPITAEMAAQADKFNDELGRMKFEMANIGTIIANVLLPYLNRTLEQLFEGRKIAGGFFEAIVMFGTMNPFKSTADSVLSLRNEIEELEAARARFAASNADTSGIDMALGGLRQKYEFAKFRQRQEALEGSDKYANYKIPKVASADGSKMLKDFSPEKDGSSDRASKPYDYPELTRYLKGIKHQEEELKKAHWKEIQDWEKAEEEKNNNIEAAFLASREKLADIAEEQNKKIIEANEKGAKESARSWERFTENVQRNLGDVFYNGMQGKFDGIGDMFKHMLMRMAADAAAADLTRAMFPSGGGGLSGFFSGLFGGSSQTGLAGMNQSSPIMSSDYWLANAKGNVFSGPGISAFSGQIVNRPTLFPFASGVGLMGEAGPEAILPLRRDGNGRLGVQASSSAPNVTVNVINAPPGTQVQQRQDEGGGLTLDVIVGEIEAKLAQNISRGSGPLNSTLGRTFGLNRAAGAY